MSKIFHINWSSTREVKGKVRIVRGRWSWLVTRSREPKRSLKNFLKNLFDSIDQNDQSKLPALWLNQIKVS